MATTSLQGNPCNTNKNLPGIGKRAPDFCAINAKADEVCLQHFDGQFKLIYTVPSLDTMVCANTSIELNKLAADLANTACIVISADLPFAQQRFCKQHKLKNIKTLSLMQSKQFAEDYGVLLVDGPLRALTARAVFVLGVNNDIIHQELSSDITNAPDFSAAIETIKSKAS